MAKKNKKIVVPDPDARVQIRPKHKFATITTPSAVNPNVEAYYREVMHGYAPPEPSPSIFELQREVSRHEPSSGRGLPGDYWDRHHHGPSQYGTPKQMIERRLRGYFEQATNAMLDISGKKRILKKMIQIANKRGWKSMTAGKLFVIMDIRDDNNRYFELIYDHDFASALFQNLAENCLAHMVRHSEPLAFAHLFIIENYRRYLKEE